MAQSFAPISRAALMRRDGNDDHLVRPIYIEDVVWKRVKHALPHLAVKERPNLRIFANILHASATSSMNLSPRFLEVASKDRICS